MLAVNVLEAYAKEQTQSTPNFLKTEPNPARSTAFRSRGHAQQHFETYLSRGGSATTLAHENRFTPSPGLCRRVFQMCAPNALKCPRFRTPGPARKLCQRPACTIALMAAVPSDGAFSRWSWQLSAYLVCGDDRDSTRVGP